MHAHIAIASITINKAPTPAAKPMAMVVVVPFAERPTPRKLPFTAEVAAVLTVEVLAVVVVVVLLVVVDVAAEGVVVVVAVVVVAVVVVFGDGVVVVIIVLLVVVVVVVAVVVVAVVVVLNAKAPCRPRLHVTTLPDASLREFH